jgi:WD40 repeat protein
MALAADPMPTYERDIKPILSKRCVVCHSMKAIDKVDVSGGLALDSYEAIERGTRKHSVITKGKPQASELLTRLNETDEERRMPLSEDPLTQPQRDVIRRWIEAGTPRGTVIADAPTSSEAKPSPAKRTLDLAINLPIMAPGKASLDLKIKIGPLPHINSLAFSPDGKTLAVGTYRRVVLWDISQHVMVRSHDELIGPAQSLSYSPDGKILAVGEGAPARSGIVRLYNAINGAKLRTIEAHNDVITALAFRPDGQQIATCSYDTTVKFWDVATGKLSGIFKGHSDFVYDVAYAIDGKSVISSSKDRTIKRIDSAKAIEIKTFGEHNEDVLAIAIRPDGSGFVSAGNEPQLRVWKFEEEKSTRRVVGNSGPVQQIAFSRDGKRLVTAGGDKSIRLFDGIAMTAIGSLPGPTEWQYAVAISHDGKLVAGGGWDGIVRVWTTQPINLDCVLLQPPPIKVGQPSGLAILPTGLLLGSADLRDSVRWIVAGKESKTPPLLPKKP